MEIGNSFHVGDMEFEGIVPLDPFTRTIVTIRPPKGALTSDIAEEEGASEAEDRAPEETSEE